MLLSKELIAATNSGDVYDASLKLKKHGIESHISTLKNEKSYSNYKTGQTFMPNNFHMNNGPQEATYNYVLSVKKWDYKKAKEILSTK